MRILFEDKHVFVYCFLKMRNTRSGREASLKEVLIFSKVIQVLNA